MKYMYPIFFVASFLFASLVHKPNLSPLFLMLTVAPQISSEYSSNPSPIKQSNCGQNNYVNLVTIIIFSINIGLNNKERRLFFTYK